MAQYTLTEAAKATGKSKSTILRSIRAGRISAVRDELSGLDPLACLASPGLPSQCDPLTELSKSVARGKGAGNTTRCKNFAFRSQNLGGGKGGRI